MQDEKEKALFKRAAEIASVAPEAMQGEAFNRALERLEAGASETDPDRGRRTKRRKKKAKKNAMRRAKATGQKKKTGTTKTARGNRSRTGSRPGPKKMLENLISEKFFDSPRDVGAMIAHIREKKTHTYKATDLSPAARRLVQEDKLEREKTEDGRFEYQSK